MNIRKIAMSAAAVALTAGMAMPVSALSVSGATDVVTDIDVRVENAAGVEVSGNGSQGAEAKTSQQSSADSSGSVGRGDDTGSSMETILVTRADVNKGNLLISSGNAAAVNNAAEMRSYIAAELSEDANLESVEVAADAVEVTYKQRARLFWFIPVSVNSTVIVETDGDVKVSYPWYGFLVSTDKAALEAKIENRVSALVSALADVSAALAANEDITASENGASARVDVEMAARVTTRAQAMIVSEVRAVMAEAFAAAETSTEVGAEAEADMDVSGAIDAE